MFKTDNLVVILRAKPEESDCFAVILSEAKDLIVPSSLTLLRMTPWRQFVICGLVLVILKSGTRMSSLSLETGALET